MSTAPKIQFASVVDTVNRVDVNLNPAMAVLDARRRAFAVMEERLLEVACRTLAT